MTRPFLAPLSLLVGIFLSFGLLDSVQAGKFRDDLPDQGPKNSDCGPSTLNPLRDESNLADLLAKCKSSMKASWPAVNGTRIKKNGANGSNSPNSPRYRWRVPLAAPASTDGETTEDSIVGKHRRLQTHTSEPRLFQCTLPGGKGGSGRDVYCLVNPRLRALPDGLHRGTV